MRKAAPALLRTRYYALSTRRRGIWRVETGLDQQVLDVAACYRQLRFKALSRG